MNIYRWRILRQITALFCVAAPLQFQVFAAELNFSSEHAHLPDPEWSGGEYERYFAKKNIRWGNLDPVVRLGARNLAWLRHLNSHRPSNDPLSFTSAATQTGIPITEPMRYNESIVLNDYQKLVAELPLEMKRVLLDGEAFTNEPPLSIDEYLLWGRKVDRVYSKANRWEMMKGWLPQLASRKYLDIRGYYYLSRQEDLRNELSFWNSLPDARKIELREWLLGLCENQQSADACSRALARAESTNTVFDFFTRAEPAGRDRWNWFFVLDVRRADVRWTNGTESEMRMPFMDPRNNAVRTFLDNIEDEWRVPGWRLALDYRSSGSIPHIEFRPGVTAHVEYLGGNKIVMDANQPLTEYDAQWTIRHEFGHVIGFKDCYVEFYDSRAQAIINYQIDIDNLMCSRRGKLQTGHVNELRRLYGTNSFLQAR